MTSMTFVNLFHASMAAIPVMFLTFEFMVSPWVLRSPVLVTLCIHYITL